MLVTEVPILAPITIGIARLTSRTGKQMKNLLRLYLNELRIDNDRLTSRTGKKLKIS